MSDDARFIFKAGQRVVMTERAFEAGLRPSAAPVIGVVATNPTKPDRVAVRIDGRKSTYYYHADFWRPLGDDE